MRAMPGAMGLTWLAAFSLSIGLGLISGGVGAAFPPVRNVGAPLVCRGEIERTAIPFSYKPGQSGISRTTSCVDSATGGRTDITLGLVVVSGLIYSAAVFIALLALAVRLRRKWMQRAAGF